MPAADALLHVEQLTVGIVERLGFASSSVEVGDRPVDYSDPDVRDRMRRAAADDPVYAAQLEQWFQVRSHGIYCAVTLLSTSLLRVSSDMPRAFSFAEHG